MSGSKHKEPPPLVCSRLRFAARIHAGDRERNADGFWVPVSKEKVGTFVWEWDGPFIRLPGGADATLP